MKEGIAGIIEFIIFFATIILILGIGCGLTPPEDVNPYWDTDGDNISNAVETNDANDHLGFDPDVPNANPSIAHGLPDGGSLEGGINLRDNSTGYYHDPVRDPTDRDDWGTLSLLNTIEATGRGWYEIRSTPRVGILDLSLQAGGPFYNYDNPDGPLDHDSHQNGLDVDVRYVKNDGTEGPLHLLNDPQLYDQEETQELVDQIIAQGNIVVIYVHVALSGLEGSVVVNDEDHVDHFHVRIVDPDGTGN